MKNKLEFDILQVGARLKEVRTAINLSLEKIANQTGFSRSLISEAENGKKKPSSLYLYSLHLLYGVNINYILSGNGDLFIHRPDTPGKAKNDTDEEMQELIHLMKHVKFVKFAMLSHFVDFKIRNKDVIKEHLKELRYNKD
jgi:transcriptional regulator with XRE-family HTH domain